MFLGDDMKVWKLKAFPKTIFGGNFAGVVMDADNLDKHQMQQIATDVGYSETAFVSRESNAKFTVLFFTPKAQIDLCGHATIATFHLMRERGVITDGHYIQKTNVGDLEVHVLEDQVFMEQQLPQFFETLWLGEVEACFYNDDFIETSLPIQVVSTGLKEIFVPVKSVDQLNSLTPNFERIMKLSIQYDVIGMHLFALDQEVDAYGRNFAPQVGIDEESATGTSSGALACYLHKYVQPKKEFILRQGYSMNAPSEIFVHLESDNKIIQKVWVGGNAMIIDEE
jgi:PhzF family phenazine biosynthesis protein